MAHEILVNPWVAISSKTDFGGGDPAETLADGNSQDHWNGPIAALNTAGWKDLSADVRACSLPMATRDTVDLTGGSHEAKAFTLARPTYTWTVRFLADFAAERVDAVLRPLALAGARIPIRVRRLQAAAAADNAEYRMLALLTNYAGFDEADLDSALEVALNFQVTGGIAVATP